MRGFFDPKPLQRVFDWVPFSLERSPIYSPATVNLNNKTDFEFYDKLDFDN